MATHDCPGGCGRQVGGDTFACRLDLYRLPTNLRSPIQAGRRGSAIAHATAMVAATDWFEANPRPGKERP